MYDVAEGLESRKQDVDRLLQQVRPYFHGDGGDIELIDVDSDGVVTVRLVGNCVGCGSVQNTIDDVVKNVLCNQLHWISDVVPLESDGDNEINLTYATSRLASQHDVIDALQAKLVATFETQSLPLPSLEEMVGNWNSALRYHYELQEQCLYPVVEMFLPSIAFHVVSLRQEYQRLWKTLEESRAHTSLEQFYNALIPAFESAARIVVREQGALYETIEGMLAEDLRAELVRDVESYLRRHPRMYTTPV